MLPVTETLACFNSNKITVSSLVNYIYSKEGTESPDFTAGAPSNGLVLKGPLQDKTKTFDILTLFSG